LDSTPSASLFRSEREFDSDSQQRHPVVQYVQGQFFTTESDTESFNLLVGTSFYPPWRHGANLGRVAKFFLPTIFFPPRDPSVLPLRMNFSTSFRSNSSFPRVFYPFFVLSIPSQINVGVSLKKKLRRFFLSAARREKGTKNFRRQRLHHASIVATKFINLSSCISQCYLGTFVKRTPSVRS
jgi:hypothetical protein